jgi:isopenicillin N synthase-like dioxygenase
LNYVKWKKNYVPLVVNFILHIVSIATFLNRMKILVLFSLLFSVAAFEVDELLSAEASTSASPSDIPIIDIYDLLLKYNNFHDQASFCSSISQVAHSIDSAARNNGVFYVINHNVSASLIEEVEDVSRLFFAKPEDEKNNISLEKGGKSCRGYFSNGQEVTSGIPDEKEGIFFGTLLADPESDLVLHDPNQWPEGELGDKMQVVLQQYMQRMKILGTVLMKAIGCVLGLPLDKFGPQFQEPTELFQIFNYPPHNEVQFSPDSMAVGEHTDYGYLTILKQDECCGGLQVRANEPPYNWKNVPPVTNAFIINIGDAFEHSLQGLYRAVPHRVVQRKNTTINRLSFPYFFDPSFHWNMTSLVPFLSLKDQKYVSSHREKYDAGSIRWDKLDLSRFHGTYGSYLTQKVSKAFPQLLSHNHEILSSNL